MTTNGAMFALVILAVTLIGVPSVARAGGIDLEVVSVLATNAGNMFDPRLGKRDAYLLEFPFSSYRMLRQQKRYVSWGSRARFNLPGPGELDVRPQLRERAGITLSVSLRGERRRLVETNLCLQNHRLLMVGGPRHRNGVLIILVSPTVRDTPIAQE